jgi:AcrR family transcriptional regulator
MEAPRRSSEAQGDSTEPRRVGRPRSERSRSAILAAAGELMLEGGLGAATIDAIALRAGVGKATIYKWWPSRAAVALEGLMLVASDSWNVTEGATAMEALSEHMRAVTRLFTETPAGPLMRSLVADAQSDPAIAEAVREQWLEPRRAVSQAILREGMASGELRDDLDLEATLDIIYAPLYYRLLLGHAPLEEQAIEPLIDMVRRAIVGSG